MRHVANSDNDSMMHDIMQLISTQSPFRLFVCRDSNNVLLLTPKHVDPTYKWGREWRGGGAREPPRISSPTCLDEDVCWCQPRRAVSRGMSEGRVSRTYSNVAANESNGRAQATTSSNTSRSMMARRDSIAHSMWRRNWYAGGLKVVWHSFGTLHFQPYSNNDNRLWG